MNTTIYATIELASYMRQPFKTIQKIYEVIQLLPDNDSHIYFSINKILKDYFNQEAKGFRLIAYKENDNYYVDIAKTEEKLSDIKKKHMIRGIVNTDGSIQIKI